MDIINIIIVYLVQAVIACTINMYNNTRKPKGIIDLIALTSLIYVLINLKKIKNEEATDNK